MPIFYSISLNLQQDCPNSRVLSDPFPTPGVSPAGDDRALSPQQLNDPDNLSAARSGCQEPDYTDDHTHHNPRGEQPRQEAHSGGYIAPVNPPSSTINEVVDKTLSKNLRLIHSYRDILSSSTIRDQCGHGRIKRVRWEMVRGRVLVYICLDSANDDRSNLDAKGCQLPAEAFADDLHGGF